MRLAIGHRVEQEPDFVTVVVLQGLQVWKQSTFRRCRGEPGNVAKEKLDHPTSVCTHGSPDGAAHGPDSLHDDCRQQWQQLIRMAVAGATDPQQLPDGLRQCYKTIANAVQVASDWDSKKAITAAAEKNQ